MIEFRVRHKNPPSRPRYWLPTIYYYENTFPKWQNPTITTGRPITLDVSQVTFRDAPENVGFGVGFYSTSNIQDIIGTANTDLFVLKDGATYELDFHNEMARPTLNIILEPAPYLKDLERWLPWLPFAGPPLPQGFFPPWPWWKEGEGFKLSP